MIANYSQNSNLWLWVKIWRFELSLDLKHRKILF